MGSKLSGVIQCVKGCENLPCMKGSALMLLHK